MLITARDLVIQSFLLYKKHWKLMFQFLGLLFIPYSVLGVLGSIIKPVVSQSSSSLVSAGFGVGYTVLVVIASIIGFWISIALTKAIAEIYRNEKEQPKTSEELADAKPFVWPAILAIVLGALAIIGGFLLLIIPGVILALWFIFSIEAVILDGRKSPKEALKASRELSRGRFWAVLWRLVAPWIVFGLIAFIPQQLLKIMLVLIKQNIALGSFEYFISMNALQILLIIVSLLLTPLTVCAKTILYLELRDTQLPKLKK
ncbi:MAG: hypothetical protein HYY51_02045 [Candidatus Magasanikbacteria bacterium]|nr:hypothetical protein [Candidatus Magasanikbacteria bacterium]